MLPNIIHHDIINTRQFPLAIDHSLVTFTSRATFRASLKETTQAKMYKILKRAFLLWFVVFLLSTLRSHSQVVINEICPTNISIIQNSNGNYDDWIELHNSGGSTINLNGYGLSDDISKPYRFTFPSYSLLSGKKVLVFTSDSTSEVVVDHWEMAVDATTSWRYVTGSSSIDTNWRNPGFNQSSWSTGNGGIGFGDSDDGKTVAVSVAVMMRKTFNIPDTSQILKAVLMMDYDDGFVAYLNGVEIGRANIGTAGVRPVWNELANSSHEAQIYQGLAADSFFIDPSLFKSLLRPTNNVFAVETHNTSASNNDLSSIPYLFFGMKSPGLTFSAIPSWFHVPARDYFNAKFKLSRNGETVYLSNPSGTVVDQKTFPTMESNNSYCRKPDGSSTWCFVSSPTPELTNNSSTCYTGYAYAPVFSVQGGYYNSSRTLTLTNNTPGGSIRYTTNGDIPTQSSSLYSSSIVISSSTVVRAKVFANGYLPSPTITNSFLINENTRLSSFSITTDHDNLWDYNTGIYEMGPGASSTSPYFGANFWMDWSRPASIEYFDKNKNLVVRFDADIEIYGNYSRAKPQKSFEIKLSDRNGTGSFNYSIYPDKPAIDEINNIILRNAGTDWNKVHFRDALMQRIMKNTYTGYLATEPAIAFLNGQYWGVYHINENHDQHWMKNNFGLDKEEIDYLVEGGSSMDVKFGSDVTFWNLYNYATVQNPSSQAYYDYVNSLLDLKNYTDYFIAETFYNNGDWIGDWTNNIKLWRPSKPGSKWRYMLYDLDFGLGLSGNINEDRLSIARDPAAFSYSSEMFDAILDNPTYKKYFINRYADLINTIYLPSNVDAVMKSYRDTMSYDMTAHFAKWGSNNSTWAGHISTVTNFSNARPNIMRDFIKTEFGLAGKVVLTLATSPAGSGRIEISTITPTSYPWSGTYFNGNPVTITAIPNPGFTFDHFRSNVTISSNNTNQSVTYNFTANDVITAYFTGSSSPAKLCVSEFNYNADSSYNSADWIELHNYGTTSLNLSGWKLKDEDDNHTFTFPTGTVIPVNGYLVITEDSVKFKSQFPTVNNRIGLTGFNFGNESDQIRLYNHQNTLYLSFYYQDQSPWPTQADGDGYTCELTSNTADPNNGNSWFAGCIGGSPGKAYSPLLAIPVTIEGNTTFCTGGSAQLHATYVQGYAYQWKRNGVDIPGATDSLYSATLSGSYSVGITYQGCSVVSAATSITTVTQQPPPTATSASRCGAGILTLYASSSDSIFWYTASTGGTLLGFGDSLVTLLLSSTTNYYARTGRNCSSGSVLAVAQIIPEAASPVTSDVTRCGPGTVTLSATDTASTRWYNAPSGGGLLDNSSTFTTGILNNDTSFYVESGSVCPSPRIEVLVTVNTTPVPEVFDASRCGNGTVVLSALSPATIKWYSAQYGGSSLYTGANFTTPSLIRTDTFYVEANSGCPSVRVRCIAIVNVPPAVPLVTDVSSCVPTDFTITAIATEQVNWYDAPTGGNLLYLGSVFNTGLLTSSMTYYAEAGYECSSARVPVQAVISSPPPPPAAADVSRCGSGSVTLTASSPELIYWYNAPSGGTLLATSDFYNTPSISSTTTYYAEAGTFCRSLSRTSVDAVIENIPAAPVSASVSRCGPGSVTLTATASNPISWFSYAAGGTPLHTGSTFNTPSISATTTYYLEAGTNCKSNRIFVQAIIEQAPSAPGVVNVSRCGAGSVSLTATSNSVVNWYNTPSGGAILFTGLTFTTPSISNTTTYYAEADNGCVGPRSPVQAIVNSIAAPPTSASISRCGSGTVTLTASSPEQIFWYTVSSGGTPVSTGSTYTTPSLSSTKTYYIEAGDDCQSTRISVQAIIVTITSAPTLTGGFNCGPGDVVLTANSSNQINWYSASTGGSVLGTGLSFQTPVISTSTTYYAEAVDSGCSSTRQNVLATIRTLPSAPSVTPDSRCGPGTVTLSATASGQIYWYSNSTGGISLGTGTTFTTNNISTSTTYYAENDDGFCKSLRTPVLATIDALPTPPVANAVTRCGPGTITLSATSPEQIFWYTVATGGTPVSTSSTYTTPSLSTTTTYYVETGDDCISIRISVQAVIKTVPSAPTLTDGYNCGPGSVTLTAASSSQVNWFSVSSGGTFIGTGLAFTTSSLSSTTTFYAEASNSGCTSPRVSVNANIVTLAVAPVSAGGSRCGSGSVDLSATASGLITWYSSATGGNSLGSGPLFSTPNITSTTVFYAQNNDGTCNSIRVPVNAIINPIPAAPSANDVSRCGPGQLTLSASSPEQIRWFDNSTGGSPLSIGPVFITPPQTVDENYYAEAGTTCFSVRKRVQALIETTPPVPVLFDTSRCGNGTVVIRAVSNAQINWYSTPTGGSLLGTGLLFTTPSLNTSTTFYAEAGLGCNSARVPVQAEIIYPPSAPVASDVTRCGPGVVVLTASSPESIYWYDASTGGNLLFTGSVYTTPSITVTTTYYVETGDDCRSARIPVQAIIGGSPVSSVTEGYTCGSGAVALYAFALQPTDSLVWYDQVNGNVVGTGSTFITPVLSSTTTYYVVAISSSCPGTPVAVDANVYIIPTVNIGPDTITIQNWQSASLDAGPDFVTYLWSTSETTSEINVTNEGLYTVTVTDDNGCIATDQVFVRVTVSVNNVIGNISLKVFPNPAHEQITVLISETTLKAISLKLFSADGRMIINEEIKSINGPLTKTLSLAGVAAGIYFLEVENAGFVAKLKVIVE